MRARKPLAISSGRLGGQRWWYVAGGVVRSVGAGRFDLSPLHQEPLLVRQRAGSRRDLASQPSGAEGAGEREGGGLCGCSGCPARTPAKRGFPWLPTSPAQAPALGGRPWAQVVTAPGMLQERCLEILTKWKLGSFRRNRLTSKQGQ